MSFPIFATVAFISSFSSFILSSDIEAFPESFPAFVLVMPQRYCFEKLWLISSSSSSSSRRNPEREMESSASLFATYSYFLEILKASHLTTNKKSHFPVVNTKAISLPLMNAIGDGSLPM